MRLLLLLLLLPVALVACVLILLAAPLPSPFPPAWSNDRNTLAAIGTGLFAVACGVGIAVFAVGELLRSASCLDAIFSSLGLVRVSGRWLARCYEGSLQGRRVTVSLLPAYAVQPWRLEVSIHTKTSLRMAIGKHRPLLDGREYPRIMLDGQGWATCHIHGENRERVQQFLFDQTVKIAMGRFLAAESDTGSWEIYVQPDRVWLRLRTYRLQEESVRQWFEGLTELAAALPT